MMRRRLSCLVVSMALISSLFFLKNVLAADLNVNILAVNGTDVPKEKEIRYKLPKELGADDIVDAAGLNLDYDVNQGAYIVSGKVNLGPKESKTFKVRIHDVWKVEDQDIKDIKNQIDESIKRIQNTEYTTIGETRRQNLVQRLDYIMEEQNKYADDVETRIDRYRVYAKELEQIRKDALSVSYWRTKPPQAVDSRLLKYVIELENPQKEKTLKTTNKHYLPDEVKPEHIVDNQGFNIHFDPDKGQSYLQKEEELKPGEKKKYEVTIMDVWSIPQTDIDNLKERSRKAFKLLENSEYKDSASYLIDNIKVNLTKVEESQAQERDIKGHISAFKTNEKFYDSAKEDVQALEDLLNALRENLERSKVKNVLQRIKTVKGVGDIAEAIFGTKPSINTAWKIIMGVVIFVGLLTFAHFMIWSKRSKDAKLKNLKEEANKEEPKKEEPAAKKA